MAGFQGSKLLLLMHFLTIATIVDSRKKLLIIQPLYTNSHERVLQMIAERLIETEGYNATLIRHRNDIYSRDIPSMRIKDRKFDPNEAPEPGYIDENGGYIVPVKEFWDFPISPDSDTYIRMVRRIGYMVHVHCADLLNATFIEELRSEEYDAALVDLYTNECGLALAHELNVSVIAFWGYRFVGHQYHGTMALNLPSVNPSSLSYVRPELPTLKERLRNSNTVLWHKYALKLQSDHINGIVQYFLPGRPTVEQMLSRVNVVLVHASFVATQSMALPPNMHFTGCVLCVPAKPLNHELEQFMQSSGEHGVVLFSFGLSMFRSDAVPLEFVNAFLNAFARFSQKFIMRLQPRSGLQVPDNVLLTEFVPQMDILGHEKTRVLVSHCGVGSVMEALYSGVPVLAVPGWLDQGETAIYLQHQGLAVLVERAQINADKISQGLHRLLNEPQFKENARAASKLIRGEHNGAALDFAANWVKMVVEFGDLPHLRISDTLQWYQYWMLDVTVTISAGLAILFFTSSNIIATAIFFVNSLTKRALMVK